MSAAGLSTEVVRELFESEVAECGGSVVHIFIDELRLFARAVLPDLEEVKPGDAFQGGVAVRQVGDDVFVHPYLLRKLCTNGAVMPTSFPGTKFAETSRSACMQIRAAIRRMCNLEAVRGSLIQVKSTLDQRPDALMMLSEMVQTASEVHRPYMLKVFERFVKAGDTTPFGFMNAITSVARDTVEPEDRWRLEELGGSIGAKIRRPDPTDELRARRRVTAGAIC